MNTMTIETVGEKPIEIRWFYGEHPKLVLLRPEDQRISWSLESDTGIERGVLPVGTRPSLILDRLASCDSIRLVHIKAVNEVGLIQGAGRVRVEL